LMPTSSGKALSFLIQKLRASPGYTNQVHFPIAVCLWQSSGKVEKFDCNF
jgi:hypothetical protein